MRNLKKYFVVTALLIASSCNLNKLDNPSLLPADSADPTLVLNGVQINLADFFYNISDATMTVSRLVTFFGPIYNNAFTPSYYNYVWQAAYNNILVNTKLVVATAVPKGYYQHSGIAKVIQAYVTLTMVDVFGSIPYSKALDPNNFNPPADKDSDAYSAALALLDDAIVDLNKTAPTAPDMYYGGSSAKWITLANTLKFKAALNKKLVDPTGSAATINALLSANDLIDAADGSEDFVFHYSTNISNPDSRHPYFTNNYVQGAATYHTNWLMWNMRYGKTDITNNYIIDPRIRYYFYRMTGFIDTSDPNLTNLLACATNQRPARYTNPNWPFCFPKDKFGNNEGYWGRDYGDASGTPPDTKSRTNWGVYPIGGKYDDNSFRPVVNTDGLQGAGIAPIMLASFTDFMKAEAALTIPGVSGSPQALLLSAVNKSINRVMGFGASVANGPTVPTATDVTNYVNQVQTLFTSAATVDKQMDVIGKEYWIAGFGNGIEIYNLYRRTGKPSDMQPALRDPGQFPNTMPYPLVYSAQNNQAVQKDFSSKVFWNTAQLTTVY
ncbi:MAG: SusD/RagB family nutrient-binding outer membrane lipoprotein [Bacteroidetes bacterium]|nr:SusD/RagB family nutrient-binding outer membrane lipoprotein [Bacteroidota bacterium]